MITVVHRLRQLSDDICVINLGQHGRLLPQLASLFDVSFDRTTSWLGKDLESVWKVLPWMARQTLSSPETGPDDIMVIHGDAPPALVALTWAYRGACRIVHVEAGERTYQLRSPFPEEFIRRAVDRRSHLLLACSARAAHNLRTEGLTGTIVNLGANTLLDGARLALDSTPRVPPPSGKFFLASFHRFETLSSTYKLGRIVHILRRFSRELPVIVPMHETTRRALERRGLMDALTGDTSVQLSPLQDYISFIHHIRACHMLLTDGGGPQEESHFLGKPCILLREETERPEHENVRVCGFSLERAWNAFEEFELGGNSFGRSISEPIFPSELAVREIVGFHQRSRRGANALG